MILHPIEEGNALGLTPVAVGLEKAIQNACFGLAKMPIARAELLHGLSHGPLEVHEHIKRGDKARTICA